MSDKVFLTLSKLDSGMANAYKKGLPKDPTAEYDLPGVKGIFNELMDPDTKSGTAPSITFDEAKALLFLVENVTLTEAAFKFLNDQLFDLTSDKDLVYVAALFEGGVAKSVPGKDVADVLQSDVVGKINFMSPGTKIQYFPEQYYAIQELLIAGDIVVFAINDAGFMKKTLNRKGEYRSDKDRMIIYGPTNSVNYMMTVVHESTHAIQDWLDGKGHSVTATEADAFIAAAVALRTRGHKLTKADEVNLKADAAAAIVVKGDTKLCNKDWTDAYAKVEKAIGGADGYAGHSSVDLPDKPGRNERAILEGKINAIRKRTSASKAP